MPDAKIMMHNMAGIAYKAGTAEVALALLHLMVSCFITDFGAIIARKSMRQVQSEHLPLLHVFLILLVWHCSTDPAYFSSVLRP